MGRRPFEARATVGAGTPGGYMHATRVMVVVFPLDVLFSSHRLELSHLIFDIDAATPGIFRVVHPAGVFS